MLKKAFISLVVCASVLSLSAFGADAAPLKVVSTNSILADWVHQVGGDLIDQKVLVGANGDTHVYEPTPKDNISLNKADVLFEIGLHLEPWLGQLYQSSGSKALRCRVSGGLMLIQRDGAHPGELEADPHVWHDVDNVIMMVEIIRDVLAKTDPEHSKTYRQNAEIYIKKLSELQGWIFKEVSTLNEDRRKLVTSHDTFGYFARRYGFTVIATVIGSATTEAADPSAATLAHLVGEIRSSGVPAIFVENVSNPQVVRTIAREAGVRVAPSLYTDALGGPGSEGEDYVKMMTYNVKTILEALR